MKSKRYLGSNYMICQNVVSLLNQKLIALHEHEKKLNIAFAAGRTSRYMQNTYLGPRKLNT